MNINYGPIPEYFKKVFGQRGEGVHAVFCGSRFRHLFSAVLGEFCSFDPLKMRFQMRFAFLEASKPAQRSAVLLDFLGAVCGFS